MASSISHTRGAGEISADCNRVSDLAALSRLADEAKAIEAMLSDKGGLNLFEVLGETRRELRHSSALAWLLKPGEPHGLGDRLVKLFAFAAFRADQDEIARSRILDADLNDMVVLREWENIDILVVSAKAKLLICIENKIGTGEHDDQLARYKDKVEQYYPGYESLYLYLSPFGAPSSDPATWKAMGYRPIVELLESALADGVDSADARIIVDHYAKTIRRHVLMEDETVKLCNEIYAKHRKAFDLIYENRYDSVTEVGNRIREWLEAHGRELSNCGKGVIRFRSDRLDAFFGEPAKGLGSFKGGAWAVYGFNVADDEAYLYFTFHCGKPGRDAMREDVRMLRNELCAIWGIAPDKTQCWRQVGGISIPTEELLYGGKEVLESFMAASMAAILDFEAWVGELRAGLAELS